MIQNNKNTDAYAPAYHMHKYLRNKLLYAKFIRNNGIAQRVTIILISRRKHMTKMRKNQNNLSRLMDKKISLEDIPHKTMKFTIYALRWIFLLIFIFISMGILVLLLTGGDTYIQIILGYSITGFFTFFMGYFGWILAQGIIEMITGREEKDTHSFSYYFSRKKKHRY